MWRLLAGVLESAPQQMSSRTLPDGARGSSSTRTTTSGVFCRAAPGGGEVLPGLLDVERAARAGDDDRADPLAQRRVRHRDDRHVGNGRVRDQQVLDLLGGDVLPAADDDVLEPVGDRQVPVGVDPPDVPGPEPPAGQERGRVQGRVGVTR